MQEVDGENKAQKSREEKRTRIVVCIAFMMMLLEVSCGAYTRSMALLADGLHQGTHVLVLSLAWYAYVFLRRQHDRGNTSYNRSRVLSLAGFTSGLMLLLFAIFIMAEAVERLFAPEVHIRYGEAMTVAVVGLFVNSVCAYILHTKHGEGDINSHSAYLHVLSDALTGVGAIIGLVCAMLWGINYIDAIVAIVSSVIILHWAVGIIKTAGKKLVRAN